MIETIPSCIVCGKELESAWSAPLSDDNAAQQPLNAVTFRGAGQYGSSVFDPMDDTYLEINVCDMCLAKHRDRVLHCKDVVRRTRVASEWNLDWIDDPTLSYKEKLAHFRALAPRKTKESK